MVAALGLIPPILSAALSFAQVPPPVPALPDSERRTQYSISASLCSCSVGFALYGSGTDVDSWLEVWVAGTRYLSTDPSHGWGLTSATGTLATIPRPVTDAVLTFTAVQTGVVQIVGAERPRRLSQFQENRGVAARDLNQALTDIIAQNRETWDKINDVTGRGFFAPPGSVGGVITGPINGVISSVGPFTSGHIAVWNGSSGTSLADGGGSGTPSVVIAPTGNPPTTNTNFSIQGTAAVITARESGLAVGLTSSQAFATNAGTNDDKVGIYSGVVCNHSGGAGDANCWSFNPFMGLSAGYTGVGQIAEFDLNNNAQDRLAGTTPTTLAGISPNYSVGMQLSGSGSFRNTAATAINGAKWQFGYMGLGDISQAVFYENTTSSIGIDIEGNHTTSACFCGTGGVIIGHTGTVTGVLALAGGVSGGANITAQTAAGSPTLTLPTSSGTFAASVTNETNVTLSLNATTGLITPGWTGTLSVARGGTGGSSATTTVAGAACTLGSTCGLSTAKNSLSGNVLMNNTANFFDGPSAAQGTTGTWFASGNVTMWDSAGGATFDCKLWDGTTIIDSGAVVTAGANQAATMHLSGYLASPAANIKISCKDATSTSGTIFANLSGVGNTDSTISEFRIN